MIIETNENRRYHQEDMGDLRDRIANQAENIARDLLGEPNPHLSKNRELRWGKNGKIVCSTSGKYAGRWYDFSSGEGGDLFDLARREKSGDFVKAKKYLQSMECQPTLSGIINQPLKKLLQKMSYSKFEKFNTFIISLPHYILAIVLKFKS